MSRLRDPTPLWRRYSRYLAQESPFSVEEAREALGKLAEQRRLRRKEREGKDATAAYYDMTDAAEVWPRQRRLSEDGHEQ